MKTLTLSAFQREATIWYVREALIRNNWDVTATARELGRDRTKFYTLMANLGIRKPKPVYPESQPLVMTPEFRRFIGTRASA